MGDREITHIDLIGNGNAVPSKSKKSNKRPKKGAKVTKPSGRKDARASK